MIGSFFYNILISPLELLVELSFVICYKAFDNLGFAIAGISVLISIITLPLYAIADKLQKKERDQRKAMASGIQRIKAVFTGDERYLLLSTFYKQNHYHPVYALRSSISLVIQVPFFIAAYHFLSHLTQLQGESFFFINDLGTSDGILEIGTVQINLLPILMTLINIIAAIIYTKGFPLRDKIQLYVMAGLFLILLYQSPAGLVLYWTLNNVFSLIKNLINKFKSPMRAFYFLVVITTVGVVVWLLIKKLEMSMSKRAVLVMGALVICFMPLVIKAIDKIMNEWFSGFMQNRKQEFHLFILSGLLLWLLNGIVLPINLIGSSPIEFSNIGTISNPIKYLNYSGALFFGLCVVWPMIVFMLSNSKMKAILTLFLCVLSLVTIGNIFLFKGDYGTINEILVLDNPSLLSVGRVKLLLPILFAGLLLVSISYVVWRGHSMLLNSILMIFVFASGFSGLYELNEVNDTYTSYINNLSTHTQVSSGDAIKPIIHLSKNGRNIVVLFLDRAISSYLPIIFEQFPFLKSKYSGFTYFPNTISFGGHTVTGAPPIMGGYEYTPDAMNLRKTQKLVDKHNEATLLLPRLLSNAGFKVNVLDPPIPNYSWSGDFSAFEPYPDISVYKTIGSYSDQYRKQYANELKIDGTYASTILKKKLPMYAILKSSFPGFRNTLYDEGKYFLMIEKLQVPDFFIDSYAVLNYLPQLTNIKDMPDSYIFLSNDTTHTPIYLQAPTYRPVGNVTNLDNPLQKIHGYNDMDMMHYEINAAALLKIGEWLDYLKQEEVYDNTRIILVSDHGFTADTPVFEDFQGRGVTNAMYHSLLLVKDFKSHGDIAQDDSFMTNGDVPFFVLKDIVSNPINPFTNKNMIEQIQKKVVNIYDTPYEPSTLTGNVFEYDLEKSFSVRDFIFDENNWRQLSTQNLEE
ncbi:YidC/Oxa1 family membrane protein insertase [Sphaerochaeta sp.]|uniref:YidC/Oxa1 family membrane protein insertase n=1 Tax=Sphaerochaeta sp. TaxID=1972642 RepID=UPI002FC8D55A